MKEAYLLAQQVNQFYLEAFNHALVVVGIVFGVVGVVVPAGIAYFQSRQARGELEQLKRQYSRDISEAVGLEVLKAKDLMLKEQAAALAAFQERSDKVVVDLREDVDRKMNVLEGAALHVQALTAVNSDRPISAVTSACNAIPPYLRGRDYENLRRVCSKIALVQIRKLSGDALGRNRDEFIKVCERAIKMMEEANNERILTDLVTDLRYELNACLERVTPAQELEEIAVDD